MGIPSSTQIEEPRPSSRETEALVGSSGGTSVTIGLVTETAAKIEGIEESGPCVSDMFKEDTVTTPRQTRQTEVRADTERLKNIRPLIQKICEESCSSGLSLGVLHQGQVLYRDNFGHRDVESKNPPDSNTLYSINSMTKALTAAAIGILVEEGVAQWNKPVQEVLPEFGDGHGDIGRMITIADLLSHRSGIASPDTFFFQDNNELLLEKHDAIRAFNYGKQRGGFRDSYIYNNFGYAVIALLIEKLSGQDFGTFLRHRILDLLHLERTTTDDVSTDANAGRCYCVLEDHSFCRVPGPRVGTGSLLEGAAGIKSTVNDLLHLYRAFLEAVEDQTQQGTTSTDGSPFKQCPTLIRGHSFLDGASLRENAYGLGWIRCQLPGVVGKQGINARLQMDLPVIGKGAPSRFCLYHEGLMPGSSSNVYAFPETMTIIVVLQSANSLNDCPDWIAQLLIETVFDFPEKNDWLELARASARSALALVPSMKVKLDNGRWPNTRPSFPLNAYCGRYRSPFRGFYLEVSQHEDGLLVAFQGLPSQSNVLRHYHFDTFTWLMTHDEAARRARLMVNFPADFYLLRFGMSIHGNIDRLYWIIENTCPEPTTFLKDLAVQETL
ncbi:MAG: hypothetical protein ALECFALPRED_004843 [Alectoria fallacina]|uniref:Beta-lactamase-related domain-containing protein n=1 Tax=Alectoria fallacina TaxID=1903189 RepID=A0A8H3EHG9_9LECA|nr:MAG: hypothetical protein ALECFALPRED_004843 [Alectoria fallacina]